MQLNLWDRVQEREHICTGKPPSFNFGGNSYQPKRDQKRLSSSLDRVYTLMRDGKARTLAQISAACGCSEAGASARLRDFRKARNRAVYPCSEVICKRRSGGLFYYRLKL